MGIDGSKNELNRIRYCVSCPADNPKVLSIYNKSDMCYSCQEKHRKQPLRAVAPEDSKKPSKTVRGKCANCQREDMMLLRSRYGKLCSYCHERIVGRDEENARRELIKAQKIVKSKKDHVRRCPKEMAAHAAADETT